MTDKKISEMEIEKTNGNISPDEARQLIQDEAQVRRERCQVEIQDALERNNCALVAIGQLSSKTWVPISDAVIFVNSDVNVVPR